MTTAVPDPVREALERGDFCHVAALTARGPHVTPMVYATAGDRVWITTSRGSVKARAWAEDGRVAGLVRTQDRSVSFVGRVITYDLLDPGTWARSILAGPLLALAGTRFTRKNARFFAGYAVDAHHVPLTWTPPGRVFAEIAIERSAVTDETGVLTASGDWGSEVPSAAAFRATRTGDAPFARLPDGLADTLGSRGVGALGLSTAQGPVVLPVRWVIDGAAVYGVLPEEVLALADADPSGPVALEVDRASWWRARAMIGAMVRGRGELSVLERLRSGARSAHSIVEAAGADPRSVALVKIRPDRVVWWRGWSSGTVSVR